MKMGKYVRNSPLYIPVPIYCILAMPKQHCYSPMQPGKSQASCPTRLMTGLRLTEQQQGLSMQAEGICWSDRETRALPSAVNHLFGRSLLLPLFDLQENKQPLLSHSASSRRRSVVEDWYCYMWESTRSSPTFTIVFQSHKNLFFGLHCTTKPTPSWS